MTDEERVARLLRLAFPPTMAQTPAHDLWPAIVVPDRRRARYAWLDLAVAAAAALALALFPNWLWLLAYHL